MTNEAEWFSASKKGLEKIARRRGLSYILFELVQNAWDTGAKVVHVTFEPVEGRPLCWVRVEDDDPDGFKDLTHAWTLFAESEKKGNPEKRGRFNLGEKLVLAVCEEALITSTKGSVVFNENGRHTRRVRREAGTMFEGLVKMTREELSGVLRVSKELILPPDNVVTTINGERLQPRKTLKEFEATLVTETVDEEGALKKALRKTLVRVYEPIDRPDVDGDIPESKGWIYEMGIPVCPTGDPWDVEIMQKVPVNMERNSVTAGYLRTLRVFVLNEMHTLLKKSDAAKPAIQDALTDERIKPEAIETVLTHQFGEKRAIFDPSDQEANHRLVADGYTIIPGGTFTKPAWENIRTSGAAIASGRILPTPKPYSTDPNAPNRELLPESEWTKGMQNVCEFAIELGWKVLGKAVRVNIDKGRMNGHAACFGACELTFSLPMMGRARFDEGATIGLIKLLCHEFSHHYGDSHLSEDFHRGLEKTNAKCIEIAMNEPGFFIKYGYKKGGA